MIEIKVQIAPNTASGAERSLYNLEAWYRDEPDVGDPGEWTLGQTLPLDANTDDITITVPTVIGRYHVAVRLVRIADDYTLPAYEDPENAQDWPAASRKLITCGEDNPPLVLTAEPWRRTGADTSEIPVTLGGDGFDDDLDAVFEVKKKEGVEPFEEFDTVTPVAMDTEVSTALAVSGSAGGGIPQGFGQLGNMLQFRAHQVLADDSQTGDTELVEVFAGVPQVKDAVVSVTPAPPTTAGQPVWRFDVAWESIGTPPLEAPADGARFHVWAAVVKPGTNPFSSAFNPFRGDGPETDGLLSFEGTGFQQGEQVQVMVWRTAHWEDAGGDPVAGWPIDMAALRGYNVTINGQLGGPPAPSRGTPFAEQIVKDGKDAMRFRIVTTIGATDSAQIHLEELRRNPVTSAEAWVSVAPGLPIIQLGSTITRDTFLVAEVDGGPKSLVAARFRQSRLIGGSRVYSAWLEWRL